jgi:hypothetical protein
VTEEISAANQYQYSVFILAKKVKHLFRKNAHAINLALPQFVGQSYSA